jgi:hypothetical protein
MKAHEAVSKRTLEKAEKQFENPLACTVTA